MESEHNPRPTDPDEFENGAVKSFLESGEKAYRAGYHEGWKAGWRAGLLQLARVGDDDANKEPVPE